MTLGNRTKDLRLSRGLTQQALATRVNTTAATIQRLETGARKLTMEWIDRLAEALDCDPGEFLQRATEVPVIGTVEMDGTITWKPPTAAPEFASAPPGIDPVRAAAIGPSLDRPPPFPCGFYYFQRKDGAGVEHCINRLSIVKLGSGQSYLRVVTQSPQTGKWTLHSMLTPPTQHVEVEWAAPVEWIRPTPLIT